MRLPENVRDVFRHHGRKGGKARAARMSPDARRAVARRAATARWIRARFGEPTFEALGLPGADIVDAGLADLAEGKVTIASLAISLAGPRLRREGVPLRVTLDHPEDRLYDMLETSSGDLAHARYTAYLRQITSFADACSVLRHSTERNAS